ncbi:MAG: 4'-phosphopantetheinyl transferase superfamily protein [Leptolyngbyaceae cyanobacterium RU_5_1]|nr:4'-phosphopantetheinyl transferase superfamily protein [Leptolyngbyaceae cyanobacterium RU_5_1]
MAGYVDLGDRQRLEETPAACVDLSADEVHLWQADLNLSEPQLKQLATTLSDDEQQRAHRFYFDRDRQSFIASRGILRVILGCYLGLEPNQVRFSYGCRGKPALANCDRPPTVQFNLAHSQGLALYAVTRDRALGVDLEHLRPLSDIEQLAKRFFTHKESQLISSLTPEQRQEAFFKLWTCKEAYLKATGEGLAGLNQAEISCSIENPASCLTIQGISPQPSQWSVIQFNPQPEYVAALAVEGQGWHLSYGEFDPESFIPPASRNTSVFT